MRSFRLSPAGTGSTSKSSKSSYTTASASSLSSSYSQAKHVTSAAWSACKESTRSTFRKGTSTLSLSRSSSRSHSRSRSSIDNPFNEHRCSSEGRRHYDRARRFLHIGRSRYRSLGGAIIDCDYDDNDNDDDDRYPIWDSAEEKQCLQRYYQQMDDESASVIVAIEPVYEPRLAGGHVATRTPYMRFDDDDDDLMW